MSGQQASTKKTMQGKIDTSFATVQRDFFASGLAAEIGMNALGVWLAVKQHADFNSGKAWPGVRRLAEWTGLNKDTVSKQLKVLEAHRLLRSSARGRGKTYIRVRGAMEQGSQLSPASSPKALHGSSYPNSPVRVQLSCPALPTIRAGAPA